NFSSNVGNINVGTIMQVGNTNVTQTTPLPANLLLNVVTKSFAFNGFLQALRDEGLLKLVTEPRLVTLSGESAALLSGGRQAIPEAQGLGTTDVKFEPFGTTLNFLPIVLGNGKI